MYMRVFVATCEKMKQAYNKHLNKERKIFHKKQQNVQQKSPTFFLILFCLLCVVSLA